MNIITPRKPQGKISAEEMERRREALRQADASNRLEGLFPDPSTNAVYERFIRGEIELAEFLPLVRAIQPHP